MKVEAFAPATVANLGLGFDILGLALQERGDVVVAHESATPGVRIRSVEGDDGKLSCAAEENTAGVAAIHTMKKAGFEIGVELEVKKGLPLGSGLGSSAASAAAAAVAVNALMGAPLRREELVGPCVEAEAAVSGRHADNVAPSLLGGLILVRALDPMDLIRLPLPPGLMVVVVTPGMELSTRASRGVVPRQIDLSEMVRRTANIAALTCACFTSDLELLSRVITEDVITESRAALIPGCKEVIRAALDAGALGSSISGSGPSVFALCRSEHSAGQVAEAMQAGFQAAGLNSAAHISRAECPGARIL